MWDGPNGFPVVTHGNTLCTKVALENVVKVIAANAFENNEMPVFLSLEDHCSLEQQNCAASIFTKAFGENLVVQPLETFATTLPSLRQLLGKIILKHKKLATPIDSATANQETSAAFTSPQEVSCEYVEKCTV